MTTSHLYTADILDASRLVVWQKLKPFRRIGVLAGGTAIALQINHRRSVDFDIFTVKPIQKQLTESVRKAFGRYVVPTLSTQKQLNVLTHDGIKVTFVHVPYKPLYPTVQTESLPIYDLRDLAADKAYTIGRGGQWRDYVDVYCLIQFGQSLSSIIKGAAKKYAGEFGEKLFLEQLQYFDDLTIISIDFIQKQYSSGEIKNGLKQVVQEYLRSEGIKY